MFERFLRFFRSAPPRSSPPRFSLSEEQRSGFFTWFHLQPDGEPQPAGSKTCVTFRPSGPAFHPLVRLDVAVRDGDQIVGLELRVKRSFIEGRQSSFARDIVKSFLGWGLKEPDARTEALIANIADLRAANEPVIMRADAMPPSPPADRTGGYDVFTGARQSAIIALSTSELTLRNVTDHDGSQWLSVKVAM
jgi:hypothetical protein